MVDQKPNTPGEVPPTDKDAETDNRPWEKVGELLATDRAHEVAEIFEELLPSEEARALMRLDERQRTQLLSEAPTQVAADLVEELPTEFAAGLMDRLSTDRAIDILEHLDADIQADLLAESGQAEAILAGMAPQAAADARRLAAYDPETAGGLMVTDSLTFSRDQTVGNVLTRLAAGDADDDRFRGQNPYILDADGRVVGHALLGVLLSARRSTPLHEVMSTTLQVAPETKLSALLDLFEEHDFLSAPVCDPDGQLLGIVSRHAVDSAAVERAESASYKRQGVVGDELRSMPLVLRSRRRLAWLTANIGLNIIAASIISLYESTLAAVIAIAIFLPMVSDMSGCSGNQAVAVSLRELALGVLKPVDAFRVWLKEVSVGLINGVVLGILIGLVAWYWKGNAALGLVIGTALALNTVLAVSIGGVIPLLLKRFNQDPAVASGPLLTTITDMAGFFLVLSLATAFMPWLK